MAKVIQVIDVDSEGHKVRLDDGRVIRMPHGGQLPHIGEEVNNVHWGEPEQSEPPDDLLYQARWATKQDSPSLMQAQARNAAWAARAVNGDEPEPAA